MGPARIIGDDMFWIMVNYTKRVESTENHHGIRLSDVVRNQIKDEGAQRHLGLGFAELKLAFKGFPDLQTVWAVTVPINPFTPRRESILKMLRVPEEPKTIPVVPRKPESNR